MIEQFFTQSKVLSHLREGVFGRYLLTNRRWQLPSGLLGR